MTQFHVTLLTVDPHAVDALPPWEGIPAFPRDREIHRLQSHVKRLIRHIVNHPVGSINQDTLQERINAFQTAERDFEAASDARRAASAALMNAFFMRSSDSMDSVLNDVIASFSRY